MVKVKNTHSNTELESIIAEINTSVCLGDDFKSYRSYKIILCYFLWKLQTDSSIKTPKEMETKGYFREGVQFATMSLEDIVFYFEDNPEEWNKLLALVGKYTDEELAECILYTDFFEEEYFESVPSSISHLIDEVLEIQKGDNVLQINSQTCGFVIDSQERHPDSNFIAYEEEYSALTWGAIEADLKGCTEITFIQEPDEKQKYTKVFANSIMDPLMPIRCNNMEAYIQDIWKEFPCGISGAWSACGWAIISAQESGRVVALMNAGQLTVKQTEGIRQFMCEGGFIEGVIMLPDKMYSDTWVNPFLVILGRNNKSVKFYDARKELVNGRTKGKRINAFSDENIKKIAEGYKNGTKAVVVDMNIIKKNNFNLSPLRYVINNDISTKTIELGEVLREVKRGISITAAEMDELISEEPSSIKCVIPGSINSGMISTRLYYHGVIKKPGKNEVFSGELLLNKTGNPFRVALSHDRYLVVGNLYILDINSSKISPAYVRCFLNSEKGQNELKKYAVGPTTPVISIANIQKIQIPIFKEKKQKAINKRCEEITSELDKCYRQIMDNEQEINSLFN